MATAEAKNQPKPLSEELTEESLHIITPHSDMKGLVTFLQMQRKKLEVCRSMVSECRTKTKNINTPN